MIAHLSIAHVSALAGAASGGPYTGTCAASLGTLAETYPAATLYQIRGVINQSVNVQPPPPSGTSYLAGFITEEEARAAWVSWRADENYFSAESEEARSGAITTHRPLLPRMGSPNAEVNIICKQWTYVVNSLGQYGEAWFFTNEGFLLHVLQDTDEWLLNNYASPYGN